MTFPLDFDWSLDAYGLGHGERIGLLGAIGDAMNT